MLWTQTCRGLLAASVVAEHLQSSLHICPLPGDQTPGDTTACAVQSLLCRFSFYVTPINAIYYQKHKAGQNKSLTQFPFNSREASLP